MYKIGLSSSGKVIGEELFESYQKAGIYGMEVTGLYENQLKYDFNNIKKMADKFGVKLWSHHLPFKPFDLIDLAHRNLCRNTVKIMGEFIKKSGSVGIDKFVVHSSGIIKRDLLSKEELHDKLECAKESLASLAEIAQEAGVSRQGVHDMLTRTAQRLMDMEEKLGVAARFRRMSNGLEKCRALLQEKRYEEAGGVIDALIRLDQEENNGL